MHDFSEILSTLQSHQDLSVPEAQAAIAHLLSGQAGADSIRQFLVLLAEKGETVDELTGAAQAMRDSMVKVASARRPVVDTCGTGGDGAKTFNISTASALVLAAAGVAVAKHGNRKITSSTGSADVLAELGINLEAPPEVAERCLNAIGICFCFAPYFHPAMKHVGEVRRSLSHPTIFNRLGPLTNPAAADRQVLGVGDAQLQDKLAATLQQLGTERSLVVRGEDGVDELSISAPTRILEVTQAELIESSWSPRDFGIDEHSRDELFAETPAESAECIREVLAGASGAKRDVVVLNAAAGLWLAGFSNDKATCAVRIQEAIDSGAAAQLVERLAQATQ